MSLSRVGTQNEVGLFGIRQPVIEGCHCEVLGVVLLHPNHFQDELRQQVHVGCLGGQVCAFHSNSDVTHENMVPWVGFQIVRLPIGLAMPRLMTAVTEPWL